jgi:hypothetical protein
LNRWKERPGELSFVPPDGRFVLAGYEVDLLGPAALDSFSTSTTAKSAPKLNLPATVSVQTGLGPQSLDFEVRLQLNPRFKGKSSSAPANSTNSAFPGRSGIGKGMGGAGFGAASGQGTTSAPSIEEMVVHIPLPAGVKNVTDLRIPKGAGEAGYAPGDRGIEWRITSREVSMLMANDRGSGSGAVTTLRGTVVGQEDEAYEGDNGGSLALASNTYDYDDDRTGSYQASSSADNANGKNGVGKKAGKASRVLMPSCATVSFSVKGWLSSGIKVESLALDAKKSKGLGAGVAPYKGVKYVCVSRRGVECRC